MIHVFLGTKAQYIKTAPVIRTLERRKIPYNLVDSGQHGRLGLTLRRELGVRSPDVALGQEKDIVSARQALAWLAAGFQQGILHPQRVFHQIFRGENGVCLVHGDTPTTLLSIFLAKRAGLAVAHLEAGLRSYNYLNPFPEELIRMLVMRSADLLFTPGDWAFENLCKMKLKGRVLNLGANTNVESLAYALRNAQPPSLDIRDYCLVAFHRVENLYSRRRLKWIVDLIMKVAASKRVLLVLHPPTELQLKKVGLYSVIASCPNIVLRSLLPHRDFVWFLSRADFVMADGGSIQEEAFYLDVPCLLLRKKTERREGLGSNVRVSGFDQSKAESFLASYRKLKAGKSKIGFSPSEQVVDCLMEFVSTTSLQSPASTRKTAVSNELSEVQ